MHNLHIFCLTASFSPHFVCLLCSEQKQSITTQCGLHLEWQYWWGCVIRNMAISGSVFDTMMVLAKERLRLEEIFQLSSQITSIYAKRFSKCDTLQCLLLTFLSWLHTGLKLAIETFLPALPRWLSGKARQYPEAGPEFESQRKPRCFLSRKFSLLKD